MRFETEASSDIRLSARLFRSCINDQRRFCADVEPGHMRVQVRRVRCDGARAGSCWVHMQLSRLPKPTVKPYSNHYQGIGTTRHNTTQHKTKSNRNKTPPRSALRATWTTSVSAPAARRT